MSIKEKIINGIKSNIIYPITERIDEILLNYLEVLRINSNTVLGYEVINIRIEIKSENKFDYKDYMKKLREFYLNESELFCDTRKLDYTKELLLRRKELQNQSNYISNLFLGVGTGFFSGILANNLPAFVEFQRVIEKFNPILRLAISVVISLVFIIAIFILTYLILALFKKNLLDDCQYIKYSEEKELQIIQSIIETKLG